MTQPCDDPDCQAERDKFTTLRAELAETRGMMRGPAAALVAAAKPTIDDWAAAGPAAIVRAHPSR